MFRFCILLVCVYTLNASPLEPLAKPAAIEHFGARIVNGEEAKDGQFPWQVAILGSSNIYPRYLCGGALISEEWVLTAAHCVLGATAASIYSGTASLSSRNRTTSQASDFIVHEYYDSTYYNNDIGLIKLRTPITFNANIQAIALAEEELLENNTVTVSGWGQTKDGENEPSSDILNYIEVETINNTACERIFGYQVVNPGLVCTTTGSPLKSPCQGDSGAPLVLNAGSEPVHVGIFSFVNGYGCEFPYPAGNTRTAYYRDWIREKTGI